MCPERPKTAIASALINMLTSLVAADLAATKRFDASSRAGRARKSRLFPRRRPRYAIHQTRSACCGGLTERGRNKRRECVIGTDRGALAKGDEVGSDRQQSSDVSKGRFGFLLRAPPPNVPTHTFRDINCRCFLHKTWLARGHLVLR